MKILAALDQSPRDRLVIDHCQQACGSDGAALVLAHVISLPKSLVPGAVREAEAYLATVSASLEREGFSRAEVAIRKGDAAHELIKLADEVDASAIVVGTRGRRGWDRLALGSVAEALVATSPRPVTVINEANARHRRDDEKRLQSYYLAGVIWNKQVSEELTPNEAQVELERLAQAGLDAAVLYGTFRALEKEGSDPAWLGLDFQIRTLEEYLPEDLRRIERTAA